MHEHGTGIVDSPDGGFAFVDNILRPQKSRLSRRMVCHVRLHHIAGIDHCIARGHFPCRRFEKLEHDDNIWLKDSYVHGSVEGNLGCLSKLGQRNEVPFHVPTVIANGHEESSRDESHLFIPEIEFW